MISIIMISVKLMLNQQVQKPVHYCRRNAIKTSMQEISLPTHRKFQLKATKDFYFTCSHRKCESQNTIIKTHKWSQSNRSDCHKLSQQSIPLYIPLLSVYQYVALYKYKMSTHLPANVSPDVLDLTWILCDRESVYHRLMILCITKWRYKNLRLHRIRRQYSNISSQKYACFQKHSSVNLCLKYAR